MDDNKALVPARPMMPGLPMMPEIVGGAQPPAIPSLEYENGIIASFFHNWKLDMMKESRVKEAEIAEATQRKTVAYLGTMRELLTFSSSVELIFKQNAHAIKMMEFEEQKIQMETQMLYFQAKNEEMEYLTRKKNYEAAA